jgi:hypothetical protein
MGPAWLHLAPVGRSLAGGRARACCKIAARPPPPPPAFLRHTCASAWACRAARSCRWRWAARCRAPRTSRQTRCHARGPTSPLRVCDPGRCHKICKSLPGAVSCADDLAAAPLSSAEPLPRRQRRRQPPLPPPGQFHCSCVAHTHLPHGAGCQGRRR